MTPTWEGPFNEALALILGHEGGYVHDPRDPGGETKFGISKRAYPDLDIANLTEDEAASLYRKDYWVPLRCGDMPPEVGIAAFDVAVNQGVGFAARALQRSAGVREDGVVGPKTLQAIYANPDAVLDELMVWRLLRYVDSSRFETYGKGWFRRAVKTYRKAVTWPHPS